MEFIDTHTHLFASQFDSDRDDVINQAIIRGVKKMLLPNIDSTTTDKMLSLSKKFPDNCFPMIGIHPCSVKKENFKDEIKHVEEKIKNEKFVAVGEIGIDLYWESSTVGYQKIVFENQIKLAKEYNLPIVIHTRNSFNEAIKIVEKLNDENLSGVFHCFTGSLDEAKRIIDLNNFYLGIGGVVTFKNGGVDKIIDQINLDKIILETDSPYLAPKPFRGKRNESKFILNIAERISEIYNIPTEKIAEKTTANAKQLFRL